MEGDWDQMWALLKDLPSVSLPISSSEATAFLKDLNEKGSVPEGEFHPRHMYVNVPIPNGSVKALALYTDTRILQPGDHGPGESDDGGTQIRALRWAR